MQLYAVLRMQFVYNSADVEDAMDGFFLVLFERKRSKQDHVENKANKQK